MKRWGLISCLLAVAVGLTAQTLDGATAVATIKFNKTTVVITQKEFRDQVGSLQATRHGSALSNQDKSDLLQEMIDTQLLKMDLESKHITVNDDDLYKQWRQRNPSMTDVQIRQAVEKQSGQTWDQATVEIKKQLAQQKYLSQFSQFQDLGKVTVEDKEIQDFYDNNREKLAAPDYIRVSHIFFDTKIQPKGTISEVQKRADETLKKITSGQGTFEELASTASDDPMASKANGDLGYIPHSTETPKAQQFIAIFGKDFYDAVFKLKKGDVSQVIPSDKGFHIVRVTQKGGSLDLHFLKLDEPMAPGEQTTVRMYIQQVLQNNKMQQAQQKAVKGIAADLRKKADILIVEKNF